MKDDHHEIQTPNKEHVHVSSNRKSKSTNAPLKKQQKSAKMNFSSVITPITDGEVLLNLSEESIEKISSNSGTVDADQSIVDISKTKNLKSDNTVALQILEDSVRISPISEAFVFEEDQLSIESYIASLNQHISPSSIASGSLEATPFPSNSPAVSSPLSSITTVEISPPSTSTISIDQAVLQGDTAHETKSIKLQLLVNQLRESMFQVSYSSEIDPTYKKLLDALVKMVIEEFCSLHVERGLVAELFSKKVKLMLLSYLLGTLLVCVGFFLFADVKSSYHGPPPT
ncbi:hypothetical protein QVD17_02113 [Tagetes erecta]|uniref:Uncharacterized protein n=1 Tax=Tagetes erecta TaxID=13708 RepID=A0AAD8L604_TARER|nr:hypothetical protein QVD17_02113 [Tagetes erecta]